MRPHVVVLKKRHALFMNTRMIRWAQDYEEAIIDGYGHFTMNTPALHNGTQLSDGVISLIMELNRFFCCRWLKELAHGCC